jgi:hypothetical protein
MINKIFIEYCLGLDHNRTGLRGNIRRILIESKFSRTGSDYEKDAIDSF